MYFCPLTNEITRCNESCRECAKEAHRDLKEKVGKAELVTEEAIRNDLGDGIFSLLRRYGFIEHCRVDELGRHWYAV